MHRHSHKTVAIPPKMSILFIAQYTYTPPHTKLTKLTHSRKVIISFIPRCFSHHFLFSVAWHRFRHLLILSNTKTFWWIFVNTLSAPSCYVKTIRIQNSRCVFCHLSMVFFFLFNSVFTAVDLCSFAQMHCAYHTPVVREKDRRDNCENKQCIKCSTKMPFYHIICIKQERTNIW